MGNEERGKEKDGKGFYLYIALCTMHRLHVRDFVVPS